MKRRIQPATMADFGYEFGFDAEGTGAYARACVVRTLRVSEMGLRARGKFDLANGYRQLADAVEVGIVREDHGFEMSAIFLGLHSLTGEGVQA